VSFERLPWVVLKDFCAFGRHPLDFSTMQKVRSDTVRKPAKVKNEKISEEEKSTIKQLKDEGRTWKEIAGLLHKKVL
jgi:hypothetical protein